MINYKNYKTKAIAIVILGGILTQVTTPSITANDIFALNTSNNEAVINNNGSNGNTGVTNTNIVSTTDINAPIILTINPDDNTNNDVIVTAGIDTNAVMSVNNCLPNTLCLPTRTSGVVLLNTPIIVVDINNISESEKNKIIQNIKEQNPSIIDFIDNIIVANNGETTVIFNNWTPNYIFTPDQTVRLMAQSDVQIDLPTDKIKVNNIEELTEEEKNNIKTTIINLNSNKNIAMIEVNNNGSVKIDFEDTSNINIEPEKIVVQRTAAELVELYSDNMIKIPVIDINNIMANDYYVLSQILYSLKVDFFQNVYFEWEFSKQLYSISNTEIKVVFWDDSEIVFPKNKLFYQVQFDKIPVIDIKNITEEEYKKANDLFKDIIHKFHFLSDNEVNDWGYIPNYISDHDACTAFTRIGHIDCTKHTDDIKDHYYHDKIETTYIFRQIPKMAEEFTLVSPELTKVVDKNNISQEEKDHIKTKILEKNPTLQDKKFEIDNFGNVKIIFDDDSSFSLDKSKTIVEIVKNNTTISWHGGGGGGWSTTTTTTTTPTITTPSDTAPIIKTTETIFDITDESIPETEKIIFDLNAAGPSINTENLTPKEEDILFSKESDSKNTQTKNNGIKNSEIKNNQNKDYSSKISLPDYLPATGLENLILFLIISSLISYFALNFCKKYND